MRILASLFLAMVFCGVAPLVVHAAESAGAIHKIGVVNMQKLFNDYKGTKASVARLKGIGEAKQAERDRIVSEIKGMRDEIALLNEESRAERQKAMEERLKVLNAFDRDAKEELFKQQDQERGVVFGEIETVVSSFAKEKGFDLILNGQAVLYGIEAADVTDQVLVILNDRYAKKHPG